MIVHLHVLSIIRYLLSHRATAWLRLAVACCAVLAAAAAHAVTINNTATATYKLFPGDPGIVRPSNTTTLMTTPPPSPATVKFYQYAPPGTPADQNYLVDGGEYDSGGGTFLPLANPVTLLGTPIPLNSPVALRETAIFHAGEPVFVSLADANRNQDPAVREYIELTIVSTTGDTEILRLQETGPDTGVFAGAIQSEDPSAPVTANDGRLSVDVNKRLDAHYQDPYYPSDVADDRALVDPYGRVFDSGTGNPVNGVQIRLIDADTGLPATVYGDDGTSTFPSTIVTGGTYMDSSGRVYVLPPGSYRFPYIAPGNYRYVIVPPTGYTAPSAVAPTALPDDPDGNAYSIVAGSYGEQFRVRPGPAVHIDIPIDPPLLASSFLLQKSVSETEASAGDFLHYKLQLENRDTLNPATTTRIVDTLPQGLRYEKGSLRVNGVRVADPAIAADGRTLTIAIGTLAASTTVTVDYVARVVTAAARRVAVNRAQALADAGIVSNVAQAPVRIREPLMSDGATIIGRVVETPCDTPWEDRKGVGNVRLLLENGTYVATDSDGQYHFEGVKPGTHVVQIDLDSLPQGYEAVSCIDNSRFANRSFSQFVDLQGGTLWRADFHLRPVAAAPAPAPEAPKAEAPGGEAGLRLETDTDVPGEVVAPTKREFTFRGKFASGQAELLPESYTELERLLADLQKGNVEQLEIVGHTDSQRLSVNAKKKFKDNYGLSNARAKTIADFLGPRLGLAPSAITTAGRGPDQPEASNATPEGMARNRRVDVIVRGSEAAAAAATHMHHRLTLDLSSLAGNNLRVMAMLPDEIEYLSGSVRVNGGPVDEPQQAYGALVWRFPRVEAGDTLRIEFDTRRKAGESPSCAQDGYLRVQAAATLDTEAESGVRLPMSENHVVCAGAAADKSLPDSGRHAVALKKPVAAPAPEALAAAAKTGSVTGSAEASGAETDWLALATPGNDWMFPGADHNPRAPALRVVVRHAPGQHVELTVNGEAADSVNFAGVNADRNRGVAVSVWRGLALQEGDNTLSARVLDESGAVVSELPPRTVHYANTPVRAEFLPERSQLQADGLQRPRLAIRLLDRDGRPVRAGVAMPYQVNAPYQPWKSLENMQDRQLAGSDRYTPQIVVEGDEGIGYVELQPTTESGEVAITMVFQQPEADRSRRQQIRTWLQASARDWVMVGFAEGTAGYRTLSGHSAALPSGSDEGGYTDGRVSFYAKGRVKGEWLLTVAYDSGKVSDRESLLSTIDPEQFYTLYGDGAEQRYDAPSQSKLYLKLERKQFYALFGDYETGLTLTELSRYSRTLNGIKTEKGAGALRFVAFAAETAQDKARDEIRGNGTSGLYRLANRNIVINSERIVIETRDRRQSQKIVDSRSLARHLDYDIDYAAGTLFFKQPVSGRDADFNPVFIVAEYETYGNGDENTTAGGRIGYDNADSGNDNTRHRAAGLTAVSEQASDGDANLVGVDARTQVGEHGEARLETAQSDGKQGAFDRSGNAVLAEYEHHSQTVDALAYVRREEPGFGIGQQNVSETGMQKLGADGQYRLGEHLAWQGEVYRQENLLSTATRDVAGTGLRYRTDTGSLSAGVQVAQDQAATGEDYTSEQITLGATRSLLDKRLELSADSDIGVGDNGADNPDFPSRLQLGASYLVTPEARLIAAQEFTSGRDYDTSLTRAGVQLVPWSGSRLETTLNQQAISEYGPRTFAEFGLTQTLLSGARWGADLSLDSSQSFNETGRPAIDINPDQPSAVAGGETTTDDYVAVSGGLTYRDTLWSWNGRVETRNGKTSDRNGFVTNFLRQAQAGVAFAADARYFDTHQATGTRGRYGSLGLSWAYRPLGWHWSVLDRLEFKYDSLSNGTGGAGTGLFGYTSLDVAGDGLSRRVINNFALNRVSREWQASDRRGNLFKLNERNQWSLYYGSKYTQDNINGDRYEGYTDLTGVEVRHDLTRHWDIGAQASALHAWEPGTVEYSVGPSIGWSPLTNAWISVGYNVSGFHDPDFSASRYTAEGVYLKIRIKFDQKTRWPDHEEPLREMTPAPAADTGATEGDRP